MAGVVAFLGLGRHRLLTDRLDSPLVDRRVNLPRRGEVAPLHIAEHFADVVAHERRGPVSRQAHRVVGAAIGVRAQAVDRHDPRVFEAAGDLGLDQELAGG